MPDAPVIIYEPNMVIEGFGYWQIGQIMRVCYEFTTVPDIKVLADRAMTVRPEGLELRNNYLLKIRVLAQQWQTHQGTAEAMCKVLLQRILDDTVATGGVFDYHKLTLDTHVMFDLNLMKREALF